ncbi:MAG TPA: phosphoribosylglycinamide formyltransferase [Thermoanaerobaculia bacterium]|nr:phosphoribosylglycinamide formyltransferase [Thermoanaerobaculia bacterium]
MTLPDISAGTPSPPHATSGKSPPGNAARPPPTCQSPRLRQLAAAQRRLARTSTGRAGPSRRTKAARLARVGILLSGRGSNFLALHDATLGGELPAQIALVVSNVADAPGLAHARKRGIRTAAIPHREEASRLEHEARVLAALGQEGIEWVCLAGYMRLLTPSFLTAFPRRVVNIHPSLLPAFPGTGAQARALEHGVKVSGCTVHLVDEDLDSGPIVVQRAVPVLDGDTPESLAARILEQEHLAYPEALRRLLTETWEIRGRRLVFLPPA